MNIPIRTPGKSIARTLMVSHLAAIAIAEQADAMLKDGTIVEFKTDRIPPRHMIDERPQRITPQIKRTKAEKKALRKAQTRAKLGL